MPESKDTKLFIRVTRRQKAWWVKQAQREGKTLSEWVISKLGDKYE